MSSDQDQSGTETISRDEVRVKKPPQYKVILLNDDYTSMDFVVSVLESIFQKTPAEAVKIMLNVHNRGSGMCGIYPKQVAEGKVEQVRARARDEGYPLQCTMEEA